MNSPLSHNEMQADHKVVLKSYSVSLAAKAVGVSTKQLYYWEQLRIIRPIYEQFGAYQYRRYSPEDIDLLIKLKGLLDEGYTLKAAAAKVITKDLEVQGGK
jgi:DNA-binding transcriptional MerR regulator